MANIKAQDLPEKLTKAVPDDRVLMIDSEDYNRLKTQPAEYYRWDEWVSPTVNIIDTPPWQTPAWHTVEITDVNWKKSFFVKDWWWDMEKAVYDKNDNGIVDDAEALGWRPAEDYALKEDVQDHINTKTFYIKWESDLTTAQEIFERFKQGKNPIVIYQNVSFNMSNLFNDRLEFMASKDLPYENSLCTPACMIYYSWNNVTSVKLRMLTAIDIKTINNETLLWQWNITIKWWTWDAYTKAETDALLDDKADKSDTYTKTETDLLLNNKADAIDVYTKLETDDLLADKQDTLVSWTNIKTINWNSLLGWWNIEIQGWSTITIDTAMSDTSTNAVQNKVIKWYVDNAISSIPPTDLSNYYNKSEINEQMWNKVDSTAYNTAIQDLQDQIDTKASASSTYTKTETNNLLNTKADKSTTYTKTEVNNLIPDTTSFITKNVNDLTYYTKTADLPTVPSKTSDLTNDSWYITSSVSNLTNYYTKTEVENKKYVTWYVSWYNIRILTQTQYNNLSNKDAKTIYIINW